MYHNIYEQYNATAQLQESRHKKAQYLATLSSDEEETDHSLHSSSPSQHNFSEGDHTSTTMSHSDNGYSYDQREETPATMATPALDPQTLALIAELQRQNLTTLAALQSQSNAMLQQLDEKNYHERQAMEQQYRKDRQEEKEAARDRELRRSIPSPKHMEEGADIVEYVELFESNMEARDIPKHMWAQTLIPLLSPTPRMAAQSLPPGDRQRYDIVKDAVLATCQETYKRAGATFFSLPKAPGESFQAYGTKLHRLCTRFSSADTIAKVQESDHPTVHPLSASRSSRIRQRQGT